MLKEYTILLADALQNELFLQNIWNAVKDNKPLRERILDRSTVASATILQSKDNPNKILIVGNTHLYFHPDADHIRLLQGGIIIYWLKEIRDSLLKKVGNLCYIIKSQIKYIFKWQCAYYSNFCKT